MSRSVGVIALTLLASVLVASARAEVTTATVSDTARATAAEAGHAWSGLLDAAGRALDSATGWWQPPEPSDNLPDRLPEEDQAFLSLMDLAGYRVVGIEVDGGWLPGASTYHYLQERMPSAADLERVRAALAAHNDRFSGPTAMRHRRIIGAILDMAPHTDFRITAIDIERGWWPDIRFHVSAAGRPLTESERRILESARGGVGEPAQP
ncbi:MAG: hypothetical protein U1E45_20700 [Geminicoccaceae bacterium]